MQVAPQSVQRHGRIFVEPGRSTTPTRAKRRRTPQAQSTIAAPNRNGVCNAILCALRTRASIAVRLVDSCNVPSHLNPVLAPYSGNPVSVFATAVACIPGLGQAAATATLSSLDLFSKSRPNKSVGKGLAYREWNVAGNT